MFLNPIRSTMRTRRKKEQIKKKIINEIDFIILI